jgi:hypothetical protein
MQTITTFFGLMACYDDNEKIDIAALQKAYDQYYYEYKCGLMKDNLSESNRIGFK